MTTSSPSILQTTKQVVLAKPMQALIFVALGALVIWMLYFSSYPAAHDAMHHIRHHTLGVSCH